jgi:hypothetical protein
MVAKVKASDHPAVTDKDRLPIAKESRLFLDEGF